MKKHTVIVAGLLALALTGAGIFYVGERMLVAPAYPGYADGTYIGEGTGYRAHLKAAVTLENGFITAIEVVEQYEKGEEHYAPVFEQLPGKMIEAQSPEVDVISGATKTSDGLKEAVRAALAQVPKAN